jgi:predicted ABC-type sugar transport system permease subunit
MTTPTHPQQVAKSASAKKMLMSDLMQTVGILPILILIVAVFGFIAPTSSPRATCSTLPVRRRSTSCWRRE